VLYSMAEAGIRVYPMQSFLITIVIKKAWRWHHLRCYMVEDAELLYSRMRLESDKFLDPHYTRHGEASSYSERKSQGCSVMPEKLCRS
jgi:hypothetical protein